MKVISIYAPTDISWWDTFFKRIEDLSAEIGSNIIDELNAAKMKNRTTLEYVIEEVCLRTDSEDDSIFPVVTIGKDKKKEESYSDYFLSLPLVESSNYCQ